jgi:exopolysaccharide biosynthesis WecB/TagA/CpsF family protein
VAVMAQSKPGDPGRMGLERVEYMELPLWTGDLSRAADWLASCAQGAGDAPTIVTHINANNYYWLQRRPALRARLCRDSVFLLDGIGLKVCGVLLGLGRVPDLNGTDLFPLVMRKAARLGLRIYLLGGSDTVVTRAACRIGEEFPGVRVVGFHGGYFDAAAQADIAAAIHASGAQMLLIGRGFLRQEEFALDCRSSVGTPLIWNVGGLFDFVSGARSRAPLAMRRARLEWLFRFAAAPRQMWHRNVVAAPWFLAHVLRYRIRHVPAGSKAGPSQTSSRAQGPEMQKS